jgi:hypothetical protein
MRNERIVMIILRGGGGGRESRSWASESELRGLSRGDIYLCW